MRRKGVMAALGPLKMRMEFAQEEGLKYVVIALHMLANQLHV